MQRQGRKVTALKFKIRRVALLPEAQPEQKKLFPELDDMPLVVKELKDVGHIDARRPGDMAAGIRLCAREGAA